MKHICNFNSNLRDDMLVVMFTLIQLQSFFQSRQKRKKPLEEKLK